MAGRPKRTLRIDLTPHQAGALLYVARTALTERLLPEHWDGNARRSYEAATAKLEAEIMRVFNGR